MNKKIKYTALGMVIVGSTAIVSTEANATIGNRIRAFLGLSRVTVDTYKLENGFKTPSSLRNKLKGLVGRNDLTGRNPGDFDTSGIDGGISPSSYYFQGRDAEGNLTTLESKNKPKVKDINGRIVTLEFKTSDGREGTSITKGVPKWYPGGLINEELKKRQELEGEGSQVTLRAPLVRPQSSSSDEGAIGGDTTSLLERKK